MTAVLAKHLSLNYFSRMDQSTLGSITWSINQTSGVEVYAKMFDNIETMKEDQKMIIYDFSGRSIYCEYVMEPMIPEINNFVFVFDFCNKSSLDYCSRTNQSLD